MGNTKSTSRKIGGRKYNTAMVNDVEWTLEKRYEPEGTTARRGCYGHVIGARDTKRDLPVAIKRTAFNNPLQQL